MARLTPQSWQTLKRLFELDGFREERTKGSHLSMVKPGITRPVVIPMHDTVSISIIRGLMRTAGMSRQRYLKLLSKA